MEEYLRVGLLLVAALILFFIILEAWLRRRRFKVVDPSVIKLNTENNTHHFIEPSYTSTSVVLEEPTVDAAPENKVDNIDDDFLIISILAKPGAHFGSYDLLQAISSTGMQFGEMNIFHYYSVLEDKKSKLFSLASATKPGDFDLDRIGDFTCKGLTLFIDLGRVLEPVLALDTMLKTAEQLADDLDGELYAGPNKPWDAELLQQYKKKILHVVN